MIRAMGWRFRRSMKILPGVRLNVGKRSASVSAGPRGAKLSVSTKREVRRTIGLPGTGLSHTAQSRLGQHENAEEVALDELTMEELEHSKAGSSESSSAG